MNSSVLPETSELKEQAEEHFKAGRQKEALADCQRLLNRAPGDRDLLSFIGRIAAEAGFPDDAREVYRGLLGVLEKEDADADAFYELGLAFHEIPAPRLALIALKKSANKAPELMRAPALIADISEKLGELDTAETAARHVLSLEPDHFDALSTLAVVLHKKGELKDAIELYQRVLRDRPGLVYVYNNLSAALLETGDVGSLVSLTSEWLARDPGNTEALSFASLGASEIGDRATTDLLLDYDRLVRTHEVAVPPAFGSLAAFNDALETHIMSHPHLATPPVDHPTWHHPKLQIAPRLLDDNPGPVADLEECIRAAIEDYKHNVGIDPGHPFLQRSPDEWHLQIWGAVLHGSGNQQPHIHEDGYLSGVYYVRVPDEVSSTGGDGLDDFTGGFEVGRPPDELHCRATPPDKAFQPSEGMMILFPAYMFHRTIPFESDTRRISIAFDVVPS